MNILQTAMLLGVPTELVRKPKPRIFWSEVMRRWHCSMHGNRPRGPFDGPVGWGTTPGAAYRDWFECTGGRLVEK